MESDKRYRHKVVHRAKEISETKKEGVEPDKKYRHEVVHRAKEISETKKEGVEPDKRYRHEVVHRTKQVYRDKRKNIWPYVSLVLGVLLLMTFLSQRINSRYPVITGRSSDALGSTSVTEKAVSFINSYMVEDSVTVSAIETVDLGSVYQIKLAIDGEDYDAYVTKDGSFLFTSGVNLDIKPSSPIIPRNVPSAGGGGVEVSVDDDPSVGPEDAPVTIVEFSDFECPFCARVVPTIKRVLEEYKGKVRLVYRDFPLGFHRNAQKAAEAAECADEQGSFWEYHDKLFENQNALGTSSLKQYAADLGLDSSEFDDCLDSGKYEEEVQNDFRDGQKYGVSGTPAFFINGILVSGAQPFENFAAIIDSELGKSK